MKRILTFLLAAALLLTSLSCALADGTSPIVSDGLTDGSMRKTSRRW